MENVPFLGFIIAIIETNRFTRPIRKSINGEMFLIMKQWLRKFWRKEAGFAECFVGCAEESTKYIDRHCEKVQKDPIFCSLAEKLDREFWVSLGGVKVLAIYVMIAIIFEAVVFGL